MHQNFRIQNHVIKKMVTFKITFLNKCFWGFLRAISSEKNVIEKAKVLVGIGKLKINESNQLVKKGLYCHTETQYLQEEQLLLHT